MLSFEISVIDLVLAVAFVVMVLLFLGQRQGRQATGSESLTGGQGKRSEKPEMPTKVIEEKVSEAQLYIDLKKCFHHFGYLRNHPKSAPIPDECFGCPKTLRCLFPDKSDF